MRHATQIIDCSTNHVCNMQHATCNEQHATRSITQHASRKLPGGSRRYRASVAAAYPPAARCRPKTNKQTNKQTPNAKRRVSVRVRAGVGLRVCASRVRASVLVWVAGSSSDWVQRTDLDQVVDAEVECTDCVHSNHLRQYSRSG